MKSVEETLIMLRLDAIARGFHEAAMAYGWSAIRLNAVKIDALIRNITAS